jgi:uncharacterized small protein (DUF1192 family)
MQHATGNMQQNEPEVRTDDLVSISEAARQLGLNKSTLSRQIKAKRIRSYDGKVRLSEVRADRKANVAYLVSSRHASVHEPDPVAASARPDVAPEDDAPIGPQPFAIGLDILTPLTCGLARRLGEMVGTENLDDFSDIGSDLISAGTAILNQEIERLRAQLKAKAAS